VCDIRKLCEACCRLKTVLSIFVQRITVKGTFLLLTSPKPERPCDDCMYVQFDSECTLSVETCARSSEHVPLLFCIQQLCVMCENSNYLSADFSAVKGIVCVGKTRLANLQST
jgi:hypothetical protein